MANKNAKLGDIIMFDFYAQPDTVLLCLSNIINDCQYQLHSNELHLYYSSNDKIISSLEED